MSLETDIKLGSLERGRVRYFPVVPGRVEFAAALRRLLLAEKPQLVAVELPGFLEPAYRRALQRLPEILLRAWAVRPRRALCPPGLPWQFPAGGRGLYLAGLALLVQPRPVRPVI